MKKINALDARKILSYQKETGIISRKVNVAKYKAGPIANCLAKNGYIITSVMGRQCYGHRLAWFLHYGEWPAGDIDHINGIRTDNRIINLRVVSRTVNLQNQRKARRSNTLGLLGVIKNHKRFMARIAVNKKHIYLGTFDTPEQAHQAYLTAKRKLHEGCII